MIVARPHLWYTQRMPTVRAADKDGGVRVLTLDRPSANAIDETLLTDLAAAVDAARADDAVRALVLTGAGTFFSGGVAVAAPRRGRGPAPQHYPPSRAPHLTPFTLP